VTDKRTLLPNGVKKDLTKEEAEEWSSAYEQQQRLLDVLEGWSEHASLILVNYASTQEEESKILECIHRYSPTEYFPEKKGLKVCWYEFDEAAPVDVKDASDVLKAIKNVWDAIFQNDKNAIANASIHLGFVLARAEVFKYEGALAMGQSEWLSREKAKYGSRKHHAELKETKKPERKQWVEHARNKLTSENGEKLKKSDVIRSVIKKYKLELSEKTVRKALFNKGGGKPLTHLKSYL